MNGRRRNAEPVGGGGGVWEVKVHYWGVSAERDGLFEAKESGGLGFSSLYDFYRDMVCF